MDTDDRPPKKYVLVRADNDDMFLVAKDRDRVDVTPTQKALIDTLLSGTDGVETAVSTIFAPLGSGVRVKVPKVFD